AENASVSKYSGGSKPSLRNLVMIGIVALAVGLFVGVVATVGVIYVGNVDVGPWVSGFVRSPGAGGFAAVVAASIAAFGLSRQVQVSRGQLEHNRAAEQERSWWSSFEWATSRAAPLDSGHRELPADVAINTFLSLSDAATTDVQKKACGGFIDMLTASPPESGASPAAEQVASVRRPQTASQYERMRVYEERETEREIEALAAYTSRTSGTPARSSGAEARLYELRVFDAIARLHLRGALDSISTGFDGPDFADATVGIGGASVIVVVKAFPDGDAHAARRIRDIRNRVVAHGETRPVVVAVPFPLSQAQSKWSDDRVAVCTWNGEEDDQALLAALVNAALSRGQ
ncbi:MAG: hypothetical protein ACRDT9_08510, partial [Agromyces sp.]